ncbi:MAG: hypothetical protein R3358_04955 [Woeseiaceae bacterium]|nr:hypothetical protein [Woeseiaceae bacterium]
MTDIDQVIHYCRLSGCVVLAAALVGGCASTTSTGLPMEGMWVINDEATSELRETLPEPRQPGGLFSRFGKGASLSVGIPGIPASVPVGGDGEEDAPGASMHSYGRVAVIEIREGPSQFGVDYGYGRGFMYTTGETSVAEADGRSITTTARGGGNRYVVRKSADDGSTLSEEFELINDGQQLRWILVDDPKGGIKVTDGAIYDRVEE